MFMTFLKFVIQNSFKIKGRNRIKIRIRVMNGNQNQANKRTGIRNTADQNGGTGDIYMEGGELVSLKGQ